MEVEDNRPRSQRVTKELLDSLRAGLEAKTAPLRQDKSPVPALQCFPFPPTVFDQMKTVGPIGFINLAKASPLERAPSPTLIRPTTPQSANGSICDIRKQQRSGSNICRKHSGNKTSGRQQRRQERKVVRCKMCGGLLSNQDCIRCRKKGATGIDPRFAPSPDFAARREPSQRRARAEGPTVVAQGKSRYQYTRREDGGKCSRGHFEQHRFRAQVLL